jgi:hypothetical protein
MQKKSVAGKVRHKGIQDFDPVAEIVELFDGIPFTAEEFNAELSEFCALKGCRVITPVQLGLRLKAMGYLSEKVRLYTQTTPARMAA